MCLKLNVCNVCVLVCIIYRGLYSENEPKAAANPMLSQTSAIPLPLSFNFVTKLDWNCFSPINVWWFHAPMTTFACPVYDYFLTSQMILFFVLRSKLEFLRIFFKDLLLIKLVQHKKYGSTEMWWKSIKINNYFKNEYNDTSVIVFSMFCFK